MPDDDSTTDADDQPATGGSDDSGMSTDEGRRALARERKAARDASAERDRLQAELDQLKAKDQTEVQRLTDQNTDLQRKLDAATASGARYRVALEKGLTASQAKRLVGDTEEELADDADDLLADLGKSNGGGTTDSGSTDGTDAGGKAGDDGAGTSDQRGGKQPPRQPQTNLDPGTGADADKLTDERDPDKIGSRMFAR